MIYTKCALTTVGATTLSGSAYYICGLIYIYIFPCDYPVHNHFIVVLTKMKEEIISACRFLLGAHAVNFAIHIHT